MKKVDWYVSDDGKKHGPEEEVRDYEKALANPLRKLHLPWRRVSNHVRDANDNLRFLFREPWLTEFINEGLPLIEDMRQIAEYNNPRWRDVSWNETNMNRKQQELLLLYERVLGVHLKQSS